MSYGLKRLVGRTLKDVRVDSDCQKIRFVTDKGDYVFTAEGDCCSQSYIDSVSGPQEGKVIAVNEYDAGSKEDDHPGEIKYHRVELTVEGEGKLDIEFRNESNGYYDGWLELSEWPKSDEPFDKYGKDWD